MHTNLAEPRPKFDPPNQHQSVSGIRSRRETPAAAVLTAAYKHAIHPLYPLAMHVNGPSHGLNGVGKAMIAELPAATILKKHQRVITCNRRASRRSQWFAFLRRKGLACGVPPTAY